MNDIKTCRDCTHYQVCYRTDYVKPEYAEKCGDFKEISRKENEKS